MGFQIQDGTGSSNKVKVDSRQRLSVFSVSEDEADFASELGNSYNFNTGIINLTNDSPTSVFYIKNNGDEPLIIPTLFYLIGNSNVSNLDILITVRKNPTTGGIITAARDMEMNGVNRNFGSSKTLDVDAYKGATGDGVTNGDKVIESIFNQSPTRAAIGVGDITLPKGSSISIEMTAGTGNNDCDVEFACSAYIRETANGN